METLGYVLVFFAKGILPWQNLTVSESEKTKMVGNYKQTTAHDILCKDLPKEFIKYFDYVKKLSFEDEPDYKYLKGLFEKIASEEKITYDYE